MEEEDRRTQHRYPIAVPANLSMGRGKGARQFELRTRDVSSAGAFLETLEPFYVGSGVQVELFISPKSLLQMIKADVGARIRVSGHVVRCTPEGVAVQFAKGFTIRPMKDQLEG